jgi:hypothetical protein
MELDEFIESLDSAGWHGVLDAQHSKIEDLWRKLFPCVAKLSDYVDSLEEDIKEYVAIRDHLL